MAIVAFAPIQGSTTKKSASNSSSTVVTFTAASKEAKANNLRIVAVNAASSCTVVHLKIAATATAATTSDFPVAPNGTPTVISKSPDNDLVITCITDTGTCDVYVTPGDGL